MSNYRVEIPVKLGNDVIKISFVAENDLEIFKKASFFMSDIPKVGPNGETDLRFLYRRTKDGDYEYYSIVSDKAGMEFQFGQSKNPIGTLFPKGWVKLYVREGGNGGEKVATPADTQAATDSAATANTQAAAAEILKDLDVEGEVPF